MNLSVFEQHYLDLYFAGQRCQWENYADGAGHDLRATDALLYDLVKQAPVSDFPGGRKGRIARAIVDRGLVDRSPEVSRLRNRLDDRSDYEAGIPAKIDHDPMRRRLALARRMRADVLQLMELRNTESKRLSYASYPDLVMFSEDLDLGETRKEVSGYLERSLNEARNLAQSNHMSWDTWFRDLECFDVRQQPRSADGIIRQVLNELGLVEALTAITIVEKEQPFSGYAEVIEPGRDVRILVKPVTSLEGVRTVCHELGHALYHALDKSDGLFQTWTAVCDEAMAVVVERLGLEIILDKAGREAAQKISLLENVRCGISFLFEMNLWEHPEEAEQLYLEHYGQLGLPVQHPEVWAVDSFRSIDPVYIQNYVLGAAAAETTLEFLRNAYGDQHETWGAWLREHYFARGREQTLSEKLATTRDVRERKQSLSS
jgi:hypothetical protein